MCINSSCELVRLWVVVMVVKEVVGVVILIVVSSGAYCIHLLTVALQCTNVRRKKDKKRNFSIVKRKLCELPAIRIIITSNLLINN